MRQLVPLRHSIATRLLAITFSIYFLVAVVVTLGHMAFEYDQAKKNILLDLKIFHHTFQPILSQTVWSINREALRKTVEGIAAAPTIAGVQIDAMGMDEVAVGTVIDSRGRAKVVSRLEKPAFWGDAVASGLGVFGYEFPIVYRSPDGKEEIVGKGIFYSSNAIVFQRVKYGFALIVINSLIKTLALWIIFQWLSERILRRPLAALTSAVQEVDLERLEDAKIQLNTPERNELKVLENVFNDMIEKLLVARTELQDLNRSLEQKVEERTRQLQQALQTQQGISDELREKSQALDFSYQQLEQHTVALSNSHRTLELTLEDLRATQAQLIESEKLASLGQLVAGVAHELNTPIGNALIMATSLEHAAVELSAAVKSNVMRRSTLTHFIENVMPMTDLIARSCTRAAELITSFKQVAIDQTTENRRTFQLLALVEDLVTSLRPSLGRAPWRIEIDIPPQIVCDSYPGPLGQVITNLVQNAQIHAFEGRSDGLLKISAKLEAGRVEMVFSDDGKGMSPEVLVHIFEPFYTTRLGQGGSGLGLSICQRIVAGVLGGTLRVSSEPGRGTRFTVNFPVNAPLQPLPV